jgi:cephalosporin-C deacetylase
MVKNLFVLLVLFLASGKFVNAQNLIPFDWTLRFDKSSSVENSIPFNMLLSWQRQGISDLKPPGVLETTFFISDQGQEDFILEVLLLARVDSIKINDHYIGGGFSTPFKWSAKPNYQSKIFKIDRRYLNLNGVNTISIKCSNYSYTGGISHNFVKLYKDSASESSIKILYDSDEHLFEDRNQVQVNVQLRSKNKGLLFLTLQNDLQDTLIYKEIEVDKGLHEYPVDFSFGNLSAGVYTVLAVLKGDGYVGASSFFAVEPTELKSASVEHKVFSEYWKSAVEELKTIPADFEMEKRDDLSSDSRQAYVVKMRSIGGKEIYGYYFVPKKEGVFPAILHLPGYGYGFEHLDDFINREDDVIELALCVRGHGLSKDAIDTELPCPGFFGYEICDIDKIAYRQIYMDCLRAVDFLKSRSTVDPLRIGVTGSSQGGGLALMTASLAAEHISACAYGNPFPTDMRNHIRVRTIIKDELEGFLDYYGNNCSFEDGLNTFDLFDTVHFAKSIKAKTFYVTGLLDDDCPARLGFAAFNEIKAPKAYIICPEDSHIGESNWNLKMMDFFRREFHF